MAIDSLIFKRQHTMPSQQFALQSGDTPGLAAVLTAGP